MKTPVAYYRTSSTSSPWQEWHCLTIIKLVCLLFWICILSPGFTSSAQTSKGIGTIPAEEQKGNIHALIIGISDYANYPDLQYADKDALAFYQLLLSDAFGADSNRVKVLLNQQATQNRVDEALMNLVSFVREGDRVFIYFSGHGGVEGLTTSRRGFLLTNETSESNLRLTSYRIDDLNAIIGELSTANKAEVFLIVDACHAGKVEEEQFKGLSPVNEYIGRITFGTIMLSSSPEELSLEGDQWGGGRGLFSYHLVNGLAGKADMDGNGIIDLTEIEFYVKSRVQKEAAPNHQHPVITGSYEEICQAAPKFLAMMESDTPLPAQVAIRDISTKGYEDLYLDKLSDDQKELYAQFIKALDKSNVPKYSLTYVDFSLADSVYTLLVASMIPDEVEVILRRKLIAGLQDRPQQLFDIILSGDQVSTFEDELCLMASNLSRSAKFMGIDHYLYGITMAKFHYFQSACYSFDENYEKDLSLKTLCFIAADSATHYASDVSVFWFEKANALSDLQLHEEAIAVYERAIELNPEDSKYYFNKGNAFSELQRYDEAIIMYDMAIELNHENPNYYCNKGNILCALHNYEEAISLFRTAIEIDTECAICYFNLGTTFYYTHQYLEAVAMFNKAIEFDPKDADYYYNNGNALYNLRRLEEALGMYNRAIELKSGEVSFYNNKGLVLVALQRYEEAVAMYDRAIELNPGKASYYYNKGIALEDLQRYEEAIRMYNKAIEINPGDVDYFYSKGLSLYYLQRYDEAVDMYEYCLKIDQANAVDYYYNMGGIFSIQNNLRRALDNLEKALSLGYDDFDWIKEDTDWDNIRDTGEFKALIRKYEGQ